MLISRIASCCVFIYAREGGGVHFHCVAPHTARDEAPNAIICATLDLHRRVSEKEREILQRNKQSLRIVSYCMSIFEGATSSHLIAYRIASWCRHKCYIMEYSCHVFVFFMYSAVVYIFATSLNPVSSSSMSEYSCRSSRLSATVVQSCVSNICVTRALEVRTKKSH